MIQAERKDSPYEKHRQQAHILFGRIVDAVFDTKLDITSQTKVQQPAPLPCEATAPESLAELPLCEIPDQALLEALSQQTTAGAKKGYQRALAMMRCGYCDVAPAQDTKFKRCAKCGTRYCSAEHQRQHWAKAGPDGHKVWCAVLAKGGQGTGAAPHVGRVDILRNLVVLKLGMPLGPYIQARYSRVGRGVALVVCGGELNDFRLQAAGEAEAAGQRLDRLVLITYLTLAQWERATQVSGSCFPTSHPTDVPKFVAAYKPDEEVVCAFHFTDNYRAVATFGIRDGTLARYRQHTLCEQFRDLQALRINLDRAQDEPVD